MSHSSHQEALATGERMIQRGNHKEALSVFESILLVEPESVDALLNLGVAALQTGDLRRGLEAHLRALNIDPANESVRENLSLLMTEPDVAATIREMLQPEADPSPTVDPSKNNDTGLAATQNDQAGRLAARFSQRRKSAGGDSGPNLQYRDVQSAGYPDVQHAGSGAGVIGSRKQSLRLTRDITPPPAQPSGPGPRVKGSSEQATRSSSITGSPHKSARLSPGMTGRLEPPASSSPGTIRSAGRPPDGAVPSADTVLTSDGQYALSDYRVDKPLRLVLRKDEAVRDYIALGPYLGRADLSIPLHRLIDYLQFSFQKVIASFFNTTRLPESYVRNIQCILQRMHIEHGITASISAQSAGDFVFQIYHLLKEHLPVEEATHRISIASYRDTLHRTGTTNDVRALYRALKDGFEPVHQNGLISLFVVHGSLSTLDFTPFSDVDTQLFLTEKAFASPDLLVSIAMLISRNNIYLRSYDPLQHHGYFIATDLDRRAYPEPFLPIATLEKSTRIFGDEEQEFAVRHVPYADRFAAWHMGHAFRMAYLSGQFPVSAFDVKRYMSRFALMPVLYLELVYGLYPYKGDVFQQWEDHFTREQWAPFDVLTRARASWNPDRGLRFNSSFHEQVFVFAERLLAKLNESALRDD